MKFITKRRWHRQGHTLGAISGARNLEGGERLEDKHMMQVIQLRPLPRYMGMKWRVATAKRRAPCATSLSSGSVTLPELTAAPAATAMPAVPVSSGRRAISTAAPLATACIVVQFYTSCREEYENMPQHTIQLSRLDPTIPLDTARCEYLFPAARLDTRLARGKLGE